MKVKLICVGLFIVTFCACNKDDDNNNNGQTGAINSTDRDFALMASMANFAEVDAGILAASKGTNTGVRNFGQHMIDEHIAATIELKQIADSLSLRVPDSLDAEHVALKAQLNLLSGREFDSTYIAAQVKDHQKVIDFFNNEISSGSNDRLIYFARKQMPHLNEHLQTADSLKTNL